jgi:hypothetical protein
LSGFRVPFSARLKLKTDDLKLPPQAAYALISYAELVAEERANLL